MPIANPRWTPTNVIMTVALGLGSTNMCIISFPETIELYRFHKVFIFSGDLVKIYSYYVEQVFMKNVHIFLLFNDDQKSVYQCNLPRNSARIGHSNWQCSNNNGIHMLPMLDV